MLLSGLLFPSPAASDDWIKRPHTWVSTRLDAFMGGVGAGDMVARDPGPSGFKEVLGLGYTDKNGVELGVGYSSPRSFEIQAIYARVPVNFGGDSLFGAGSVHLADGTADMVLAGASWSGRFHMDRWGVLGDGLACAGILLGLMRVGDVRLTPEATSMGVTRIDGRSRFAWAFDMRIDQRFPYGIVGSLGLRTVSAAGVLHVETDPASGFQSADASFGSYVVNMGLAYWF